MYYYKQPANEKLGVFINMLYLIKRKIQSKLYKIRLKKQKNVLFKKKAVTDINTIYEGYNKINPYSCLLKSYIGKYSYMNSRSKLTGVKIGRFTSIGPNVKNLLGRHPSTGFVSTHPVFYSLRKQVGCTFVKTQKFDEGAFADEEGKYANIIGNDVWIGANSIIIAGVKIGDGAIVASGSIVTKDVEPYTIVGGVPAKVIKYRFKKEDIDFLLKLKWWERDDKWIKDNAELFEDINLFKTTFEKNKLEI